MAGINSWGFEIPQRFDLGNFPKARAKRQGPVVLPQEDLSGGAAQAYTRIWTVRLRTGVLNSFTRGVSPSFQGPALLKNITISWTAPTTAALNPSWGLGFSESPIASVSDQAGTDPRPGTVIIDHTHVDDTPKSLPLGYGSEIGLNTQGQGNWPMPLDYLINAQAFVLWLSTNAVQNANHSLELSANVICNVSQRTLQLLGV